jgi:hypothetical protein
VLFQDGKVLLDSKRIYPGKNNGLEVREGKVYRLRDQPMLVMTSRSRETDEEEQVAPLMVRKVTPIETQV